MKKLNAARYYLFRFLGWLLLLGLLYAMIEYSVIYSISKATSIKSLFLYLYKTNKLFPLFIFNILIGIIPFQIALNKVFFKSYKHITITPKFQSLSFWFATKTYLKILGCISMTVIISYFLLLKGISISYASPSAFIIISLEYFWYLISLFLFFGPLLIINRTVKKNATIEAKIQET